MNELTFESVNREIENLDLNALQSSVKSADFAVSTSVLCDIWKKVSSIIRLIAKIPLIPKKWRDALDILIGALDALCP